MEVSEVSQNLFDDWLWKGPSVWESRIEIAPSKVTCYVLAQSLECFMTSCCSSIFLVYTSLTVAIMTANTSLF